MSFNIYPFAIITWI